MPTNLLHHGSQNRIQKTSRNMAVRKGPRLHKKQSGTQNFAYAVQVHLRPCSLNINVNSYLFLFVRPESGCYMIVAPATKKLDEMLHLSRKSILAARNLNAKMQPSKNQLLDLRTLCMPLALRLPRKMHLCRSSSNLPRF